ncbi:MAG: hypothetical protein GX794_03210 [Acholeplasmataceae bacterium]|nr:hypothetical protein [Acholeplasmataceae bacterium]
MKKTFLIELIKLNIFANKIDQEVKIYILIGGLIVLVALFIYLSKLIFKRK